MKIPFIGGSYQLDARSFAIQRSINLYPIISEADTKSVSALRSVAGLTPFATAGGGAIRGMISSTGERGFIVSGNEFYELSVDGVETPYGTLNSIAGLVSMAENDTQVIVVDGQDGWIFTKTTNAWAQITDPQFPTCSVVDYQDGYFLAVAKDTQNFHISNLRDGLNWDALDFTTVESSPDDLISLKADKGNVWLFGNRSTEVYQNNPVGADFPFQRVSGAVIQTGCAAKFSVQKFDEGIIWLSFDEQGKGVVLKTNGYGVERVSTEAIETRISESVTFQDSYAWVYHQQGHIFYCLQVPDTDTTLVYDGSTGMWHERAWRNPATASNELHRGSCHMFFGNRNLVGDRLTNEIHELSLSSYDDNGDPLIKERISPHYHSGKGYLTFSQFELDAEVGIGRVTGQGSDPQIMLQYSDDGGITWSNELWETLGKLGKYRTRVEWRRLGRSRDRVFKVKVSDPVFVQLNEAYINAT